MSFEKEIQDAFKKIGARDVDTFAAKVVSVDKDKGTCVVDDGTLEYTKVRLSSIENEHSSFAYIFPKVESSVLVSPINEDLKQLYVEAYSEVEDYYIKIDSTEFRIDANGILLKKGSENAQKLLLDLVATIRAMVFTTNQGPTINLVNDAQFEALNPRIESLFKET